jgi:hypothetical protein
MTTLEELLTMMAEDAARAAQPQTRPPPIPPKKVEAIGPDEIASLDDGPVLKDRLWPSALPRPARRGPPPPPGRRARGTDPLSEPVNSGLIDVRSMALAYQAELERRAEQETLPLPPAELAEASTTVKLPEPPEAAPAPVIAEGTRPFAAVVEEAISEPVVEKEKAEKAEKKAAATWLIARRAVVVLALAGTAAAAVAMLVNRARSEGAASDPDDYTARVAPAELPAASPALPEVAAPVAPAAEPAVEPVVIVEPTRVVEMGPPAEAAPALATTGDAGETEEDQAGPGHPPPELLADGCFDAACAATATPVHRPRPPAAQMVEVPARLALRPSGSEIASTIFSAQDQIEGCGAAYGMSGQIPLKIKIAASGAITSVAVGQGTTRFRTCVSDIVSRLKMPASTVGTSASFPVLLR